MSSLDTESAPRPAPSTTLTGAPLQSRPFSSLPTLIPHLGPDGRWSGGIVKVEQVLLRSPEGGARAHLWIQPDLRPHNHPWRRITCRVIRGSYRAREWLPFTFGDYREQVIELTPESHEHSVDHATYHQVEEVRPGTVSIMSFGAIVGDGKQWGQLALKPSGRHVPEPAMQVDGFVDALRHCNPHLRPGGWTDPYADQRVPTLDEVLASVGM